MNTARRRGYSLTEVVFAVAALGLILAVVVMSVPRRRHTSERQVFCLNNQSQIAKAHLAFHSHNGRFCGYVNRVGRDYKTTSWVVPIFPYIDRADLYDKWSNAPFDPAQTEVSHPQTYIESLICPHNPPLDEKASPLGYVVNGGFVDDAARAENVANGIFHNHCPSKPGPFNPREQRVVTLQYLAANDGAAKTMLLSENVQWVTTWRTSSEERAPLAFIWHANDNAPERRINQGKKVPASVSAGSLDYARPSSWHANGVNVAFADGHGKFIDESIDYRVYQQMMTPAGKKSSLPGLPELEEEER